MIMINRAKVLEYAKTYWWRPCKDQKVWVQSVPINVADEAVKAKNAAEDYVGVFLWYPSKNNKGVWEALCLVPKSLEKKIADAPDKDRTWAKYQSVAIPLASYKDDPKDKDENLEVFLPAKVPYVGLNDCTHFTSQCLIAGGFPVTKDEARRGAGDLADYLQAAPEVTTLCYMAEHDDVKAVVDAGIVRPGDVFAYYGAKGAHHTVPAISGNAIAMHTWHAFGRPWDLGKSNERISFFHFKDDNYKTPDAKSWLGWWKIEITDDPGKTKPEYYHFGDGGALAVASEPPKNAKEIPKKAPYNWFSTKEKTAAVVRRKLMDTKTTVETFTFQGPKPYVSADGDVANPPNMELTATKLP